MLSAMLGGEREKKKKTTHTHKSKMIVAVERVVPPPSPHVGV